MRLRERPAVSAVAASRCTTTTVDAYWLVYPPALHDWRPLALLRRWLHAQIEASSRAWSASDASPLASVGAAALQAALNPPAGKAPAGR